jgi:hypothetical protein
MLVRHPGIWITIDPARRSVGIKVAENLESQA